MTGSPDEKGKATSPETPVFKTGVAWLNPALSWGKWWVDPHPQPGDFVSL